MQLGASMQRFLTYLGVAVTLLVAGCTSSTDNQHIEKQIRGEVLRESSGIATLEAIYTVAFVHFEENLINSDDFYIQKDAVFMDYGFDLDDNSIKVVDSGGRKTLQVRLGKGDVLATNRLSIGKPKTTHEGYQPKNAKTGEIINVDEHMNKELEEMKRIYGEKNLKHAKENLKNFFKVIATKYDLDLDFQ